MISNKTSNIKNNPSYSQELKENLVRRMLPPESICPQELSKETGISRTSLHNWFKALSNKLSKEINNKWIEVNIDNNSKNKSTSAGSIAHNSGIVIEIGKASIKLSSNFDKTLLLEVVKTLGELC